MITISFARCKVAYAPCSKVLMRNNSNGSNDNAMKYELLYLALQVVLMHYVPFVAKKNIVYYVLNEGVFGWEKCLLILRAVTVKTKVCSTIHSVDIKIGWSIAGLLI